MNKITPIMGIYGIYNIETKKWYVGQSIDIRKRFKEHLNDLKNGKDSELLQEAWKEYGQSNFKFKVIYKTGNASILDLCEVIYIKACNAFADEENGGYNLTTGGKNGTRATLVKFKQKGYVSIPSTSGIIKTNPRNENDYIINQDALMNWVSTILFDIIKNNVVNLKYGGYRLWDNDNKFWITFMDDQDYFLIYLERIILKATTKRMPHKMQAISDVILRNIRTYIKETEVNFFERGYVAITFEDGTLYIYQKGNYNFAENEFKKENYCLYKINTTYKGFYLNKRHWKQKNVVGKYLSDFYTDIERELLQRFLGQIFVPEVITQQVLILIGEGANGKTQLVNAITNLFYNSKKYVTKINVEEWEKNHKNVDFTKSIFNTSDELNSQDRFYNSVAIKNVLGGSEIQINPKYMPPFSLRPFCKHLILTNTYPQVKIDSAILRRFLFIKIGKTAKDFPQTMTAAEWEYNFNQDAKHLLSFMLCGLVKQIKDNFKDFITPDINVVSEFAAEKNNVAAFIADCIIQGEDKDKLYNDDLYKVYQAWLNRNNPGATEESVINFHNSLKTFLKANNISFKPDKTNGKRIYWKIQFNDYGNTILKSLYSIDSKKELEKLEKEKEMLEKETKLIKLKRKNYSNYALKKELERQKQIKEEHKNTKSELEKTKKELEKALQELQILRRLDMDKDFNELE